MKRILITGGTGVVGSALAPLYLNDPDWEVWMLIRAGSEDHLQERVGSLLAYWADDLVDDSALRRLRPIIGDVTEAMLGVRPDLYETLCSGLTHIVHCAASVKMNMNQLEAHRSSVEPARNILRLVEACRRNGQFEKLDYVSTIGVSGRMPGLVPEEPLTKPRAFHNTYESSKAEAEELVLGAGGDGLAATIHRPSMVVGHSRTGKVIQFQVFYYLSSFLCGLHTHGFVPQVTSRGLDIVPSDYVAAAIHWSSTAPESVGRILHLCSGPENSIAIMDLARRVREVKRTQGTALPGLRPVSVPLFKVVFKLLRHLSFGKQRQQLMNLSLFLDYMGEHQDFDNRRSSAVLSGAGVELPQPERYLGHLFHYQDRMLRDAS